MGFFWEENTVIGIKLTNRRGEHAKAILELFDKVHRAFVLIDLFEVPNQVTILLVHCGILRSLLYLVSSESRNAL